MFLAAAQAGQPLTLFTAGGKARRPPYNPLDSCTANAQVLLTNEKTKNQHGPSPALGTGSQESLLQVVQRLTTEVWTSVFLSIFFRFMTLGLT